MKKLIPFIGLILVMTIGGYFIKNKNDKVDPKIKLVINNPIKSFDPAVVFNDDSLFVMGQTLETLYQYHYLKRPYEVIPLLAESMPEISDNGKTYRIKIKKGIKYQNHNRDFKSERTVKAEDFVWQIKRIAYKPLKSTGTWLFKGKLLGFDEFSQNVGNNFSNFLKEPLAGAKAIDEYTLELKLNRPEPNLLYFLSMVFTAPMPIELIKKHDNNFTSVLVGTGAYKYLGYKNEIYHFNRFTGFHEEYYPSVGDRYANTENLLSSSKERLPFINEIEFKVIKDEEMRWFEFNHGNIDILDVPKRYLINFATHESKISKEFAKKGVEVKHFSRQTSRWLGFNMNDPILGKNKSLRKAISHGIDFEKYIEVITKNTNLRSNSIFNPSIPGYRPDHQSPHKYDLTKAKEYLKKSGIKPGELTLTYSTRGKQKAHFEEAEFLQQQLNNLGINLKVNALDFSEFLKKGRSGQLQFWTDNWIYDYPDAENLLQLLITKNHPGINKSGFSNPEVNNLYDELSQTLERDKRFEIMYNIEKIVEEEVPWIMLMYESTYIVQQKEIHNFRKSFFIRNYIKYLQKK
jgi:ABC-type transport system substrate-binding protein